MNSESLKVAGASMLGLVAPVLSLDGIAPVLNLLLVAAQLAVAVVSALYIYSKWKKNRK